jgi:hypothetical protein
MKKTKATQTATSAPGDGQKKELRRFQNIVFLYFKVLMN